MRFSLATAAFCRALSTSWEGRRIADQLFRAATSVGANHRAACRARSRREFIAKLGLVVEEADESLFWLEFTERAGLQQGPTLTRLQEEASELLRIFVASSRTAGDNATHNP